MRSYQHASRIFVDGDYRLSPKYGFLFYVEFDFNPLISNVSNTSAQEMGMIVKNINLPKFTMDIKAHNAYNRVNLVQNKIKYDPINIVFHDDQADTVRDFWYDYYSFFYRDSDYNDATYSIVNKYQERPSFEWGYTPRPVSSYNAANAYQSYQYIQAIRIYSLYQKNFAEYELINPIITSFRHGEHNTSEGTGLLEHQMSVQFETVKYQTGYTTQNTVGGYIDLHYDNTPTPLVTNPSDVNLVDNGHGGVATAPDTITDLANFNLSTSGGQVVPQPSSSALAASVSFSSITSSLLSTSATNGVNAGGFALPALGSLTSGLSNSNLIQQQLQAATISLAGRAASTLAGGVIGGITSGLGPAGTAVLGLAVSAIANPSATLKTAENMAINYATNAASSAIQNALNPIANKIQSEISGFIGDNITTPVTAALGDASTYIQNQIGEGLASFSFGGADDAVTAALFSGDSSYDAAAGWSS